MNKKFFSILVAIVMLFALCACNDNTTEILNHCKQEVDEYAEGIKDDFSGDWAIIEWMVNDAQKRIDSATSSDEIYSIVEDTKTAIDEVVELTNQEEMRRLNEQYDQSDSKIFWDGDFSSDGSLIEDRVNITTKKTCTYPELTLSDFHFDNGEEIISAWLKPIGENPNINQSISIKLKEGGK